jgi:sorting nexin-29
MYKVFSNILYIRLKPYVKEVTGSYQCGFRGGKSTTDHIQALCQVLERTRGFNTDTFHLFIDFKAAYDSIKRDELLSAMQKFGIPVKSIHLTRSTLKRVKCRIKLQSHPSEPFLTQRGLRQGDALACLLFNIALEKVLRGSGCRKTSRYNILQISAGFSLC